jgi:hypothetical protein
MIGNVLHSLLQFASGIQSSLEYEARVLIVFLFSVVEISVVSRRVDNSLPSWLPRKINYFGYACMYTFEGQDKIMYIFGFANNYVPNGRL